MTDTTEADEWETRPFHELRALSDFQAKAQHKGHIGYQEEVDFSGDQFAEAAQWCIDKSREPHVKYAALYCGGAPQRSWDDGELSWNARALRVVGRCIHNNEHDIEEGRET